MPRSGGEIYQEPMGAVMSLPKGFRKLHAQKDHHGDRFGRKAVFLAGAAMMPATTSKGVAQIIGDHGTFKRMDL